METKHVNWFALLVVAGTIIQGARLLWIATENLISGGENYVDSWFFVLIFMILFCWYIVGPRELVVMRALQRKAWKKIAQTFQLIRGLIPAAKARIRNLAGLFTPTSNNNLQTEP